LYTPFRQKETTLALSYTQIQQVWDKGRPILGFDPAIWRHDEFGRVINRFDHGNITSQYGWEVDHIIPVARNGTDALYNLRPLHRQSHYERHNQPPPRLPGYPY